jgi:hypothetical protein
MPVGQLAPRDVPPQQEPQHDLPQYVPQEEEPYEVKTVAHEGQESQEAQTKKHQLLQNDENNNNVENDIDDDDENNDEEYTPLSDSESEKMYRDVDKLKFFGNEAPIPTGSLWALLGHVGITTAPEFWIKRIQCLGREEFWAVMEIFNGPNVVSRHMGPAFRASCGDAVADVALQAITAYNRTHQCKAKNSIYHFLSQRKKDKFKASWVNTDIPRIEMAHHQDVFVEMSISL